MKAMILAAGLGTRLKPITDKIPKALVEVEGVPMLERVILSLKKQGFDELVVNVHHFSEQIINFLSFKDYGVEISISDESKKLLDTGGGIVNASPLLFRHNDGPVLIHNVDILSNADLRKVMEESDSSPVLLVSDRESSRKLLFDKDFILQGWHDLNRNVFRPDNIKEKECFPDMRELAFSGIYSITKDAVLEMKELMGEGKYSVIDYFLHPERCQTIYGLEDNTLKLIDIGKPATLSQASDFIY